MAGVKKKIDRYIKVAEMFNVHPDVVKEIIEFQFDFTYKVMAEGKDEPVRLRFFGLFHVKPDRRVIYEHRCDRAKFMAFRNKQIKKLMDRKKEVREHIEKLTAFNYDIEE